MKNEMPIDLELKKDKDVLIEASRKLAELVLDFFEFRGQFPPLDTSKYLGDLQKAAERINERRAVLSLRKSLLQEALFFIKVIGSIGSRGWNRKPELDELIRELE
ncbi:TPA: hypothetical protein DF272_04395 [Candidatus Falkowbacteria bacterium]|nr:hypothetical protein [Candidatus Falkowbacteria bacterium]